MKRRKPLKLTPVEEVALKASKFDARYSPEEKITTIVVDNFPALGKLTAMRFIEWVQNNPGGVISLPTGKTPEQFISWVKHLLDNWKEKSVQTELENFGVDPAKKPDMKSLHFVQIDEFYPINPRQDNSFFFYVNHFYIKNFGLDPAKSLLMDCSKIGLLPGQTLKSVWPEGKVDLSLRYRSGKNQLERIQKGVLTRIDQWCQQYEETIRGLGGIGFFLGGIGPDGHIGFNVKGSDHYATTRLTNINYETQAAAAGDLGGIEIARDRLVITIGLGTITHNPECCAIIIAAGEAKADIIAEAIQEDRHVLYPATALHILPMARFYITMGAAKNLYQRQLARISQEEALDDAQVEKIVIDLSVKLRKRISELTKADFKNDPFAAVVLSKRSSGVQEITAKVHQSLIDKIEKGTTVLREKRFLHTEPHHDDIMLGYLPFVVRHTRDASNTHFFMCLTGGFTSVSNRYMLQQLDKLERYIDTQGFKTLMQEGYFDPLNDNGRNRDVWQYLDGVAAKSRTIKDEGTARRFLRNLIAVYEERDLDHLFDRIQELRHYFETEYPGKKDLTYLQNLKAMCREWEAECLWGYFGWNPSNVMHLRLGFYTGDIFTQEPTIERDVIPILNTLNRMQPDIVTVAFDPEASGPDTHYKVLQAISEALKRYEKQNKKASFKIWGYRNVWYRFHPGDANIYVPVSLNMFSIMQSAFLNSFISQKDASFPSYQHDGPFSELAQKIQVDQYQKIKICLGREWFYDHPSPLIRATRGLVFLKEMEPAEFYRSSRELKQALENR